jgi:hypothetical protein
LALTAVVASCSSATTRAGQGANSTEPKAHGTAQSRSSEAVPPSPTSTIAAAHGECQTFYSWFHLWHIKDSVAPPGLEEQMFRELEHSSDAMLSTYARSWQAAWNGTDPSMGVQYLTKTWQRCLALGQVDPYGDD